MTARLLAAIVTTCLCGTAFAQSAVSNVTKQQRDLLKAIVLAVDAAASTAGDAQATWQTHVLRASDGSHYVAFSVEPPADAKLPAQLMLYVRLATAVPAGTTATVEQSAIKDWLAGRRVDPRMLNGGGIAVGEMPAFGAGGIAVRGSTPSTGSNDLRLMSMERERAKQEQEERDKQRRAELEGKSATARDLLPFEDFDVSAPVEMQENRAVIRRAFTAGPGDFDLYVGWGDPSAPKPLGTVRVLKHRLALPTASTAGLTLSSVILANNVSAREVPYSPAEQSKHPYAIGATDIAPARDAIYTRDERIAVAFQVINAQPSATGKPDLTVNFRVVRLAGDRETQVATLSPQRYDEATMPREFDLRLGHPIFAAVAAPLATLARGDYRLKILVNDRLAGTAQTAEVAFTMIGTAASLLAEAPPLGPPFNRQALLDRASLDPLLQALTPATPSAQLRRALDIAATGKFVDLLVEEPVPAAEQGVRVALTGLALYSIGDQSAAATLQRALQLGAPAGPVQTLIGGARAAQGRDPDAIAAWQAAVDAGERSSLVAPWLVDALLRRNDPARAAAVLDKELGGRPPDAHWIRAFAAVQLANGRDRAAVEALTVHVAAQPADAETQWLLLQALYAQAVHGDLSNRGRLLTEGRRYVEANGAHAELAREWLKVIEQM
jgi:hypothetical protein